MSRDALLRALETVARKADHSAARVIFENLAAAYPATAAEILRRCAVTMD